MGRQSGPGQGTLPEHGRGGGGSDSEDKLAEQKAKEFKVDYINWSMKATPPGMEILVAESSLFLSAGGKRQE